MYKKKGYLSLLVFGVYFFSLIEVFYLITFKSYLTSSSIFIFFESNSSEITSFTKQYLNVTFCSIASSYVFVYGLFLYLWLKNKINLDSLFFSKFNNTLPIKVGLLLGFIVLLLPPLNNSFFPVVFVKSLKDYKEQMDMYNKIKFNKKSNYFQEVTVSKDTLPETYVLIIGESTTNHHMGIYGYYRNTTPLLNSVANELIVYKDVICPNTHTLTSLEKVLTLGNTENLDLKYEGNLLQLFNQAGFVTYWISNQRPSGIWDNFITGISNSAEKKLFFNISNQKSPYDEIVLDAFKKVLLNKNKKKLIVLHLMGTHMLYKDRYPNTYNTFTDTPKTSFKSETAFETINAYDNAIVYQDYIWFTVLKQLKEKKEKAAILFLSDHGEEVYETIDFSGHTESKGTKAMYDIPFMLWLSETKKKENNDLIYNNNNRSYSSENLLYTMADLASIKFKAFDSTKSILNKKYERPKRLLINNEAYEDLF
ncbi:phosphoethanolamine transferase [Flavobacterium jejuense]|uniref:Phosphoethanolamine transferase n=1 Tax=Flavobacterium jejuense TaxID=1544455 RepID=A0ABX0IYL7_9FLAO|nr:phosphoethanolamine transferase [Flavobacterium jejuense]NHN26805.1 phosphoethanolamine transferase [Flavobacterium jejuense]